MKVLIVIAALVAVSAAQRVNLTQVFGTLDKDGDHHLTKDEMMGYFRLADKDGNGNVTYEEYAHDNTPAEHHQPEVEGPFVYYDKLDGTIDHVLMPSDVDIIFNRLDTNKDSRVSDHEFMTGYTKVLADIQAVVETLRTPVGK